MKKVLVVEDNILNLELVLDILGSMGFEAKGVEDGKEALSMIEKEQYDLILMDIELPGMNGIDARENIKRKSSYEKVPVIAITAYAMKGDKERLIASGFDDYMAKPIDVTGFIKKIEKYK
jgi:CheY-like chemotaxis protein